MLRAFGCEISVTRLVAHILVGIFFLNVAFTAFADWYLTTLDWPDNSWPGWLAILKGDLEEISFGLPFLILAWWLYRREKRRRPAVTT
jgi:hypothetical protein